MGNHTNPMVQWLLMAMAEIPTMSENKARESGIFGFPWFQPCLFSQKRWGAETWPGNIELRVVIGESPKKISWSSDIGQQRYGTWKTAKIAIFRVPYLSSPMSELHEIFFGDSPFTTLNSIFPGHVRTTHHFREKRHSWNHGNPKMPLSLALFSDMVGISAMDQRKILFIGLVWFPIQIFGIFQSNGAEIFDVENHKRKSLL